MHFFSSMFLFLPFCLNCFTSCFFTSFPHLLNHNPSLLLPLPHLLYSFISSSHSLFSACPSSTHFLSLSNPICRIFDQLRQQEEINFHSFIIHTFSSSPTICPSTTTDPVSGTAPVQPHEQTDTEHTNIKSASLFHGQVSTAFRSFLLRSLSPSPPSFLSVS